MTRPVLEARGIVKRYAGDRLVLPGLDLTLRRGQILALLGPSGCGKSTLLNILAGFVAADAGEVLLEGRACHGPGPDRAVVFQEDALFPWLTALENVTLGLRAAGLSRPMQREQARRMVSLVGLNGFEGHLPGALSGGMRQRLALARVLALSPKVLLMDEPFAALDAITRGQMHELLLDLHAALGMSLFMVTHDVAEAVGLADVVHVMGRAGQGLLRSFPMAIPRPRSRLACLPIAENVHALLAARAGEAEARPAVSAKTPGLS